MSFSHTVSSDDDSNNGFIYSNPSNSDWSILFITSLKRRTAMCTQLPPCLPAFECLQYNVPHTQRTRVLYLFKIIFILPCVGTQSHLKAAADTAFPGKFLRPHQRIPERLFRGAKGYSRMGEDRGLRKSQMCILDDSPMEEDQLHRTSS